LKYLYFQEVIFEDKGEKKRNSIRNICQNKPVEGRYGPATTGHNLLLPEDIGAAMSRPQNGLEPEPAGDR
jgi:hypothetical protein